MQNCGDHRTDRVPNDELAGFINILKLNNPPPLSIDKHKNADTTWTVIAHYPPCKP